MKRHAARILLGLTFLAVLLAHVAKLYQIPFLSHQDTFFYDARVRMTMPGGIDERIVIVALDEKSLREVGRWPWGRDKVAELVRRTIDDYGAAVIGFDVVFAEADQSSGLKVLETLAQTRLRNDASFRSMLGELRRSLDYDQRLADAFSGRPVVLGYYFSNREDAGKAGALPEPALPAGSFAGRKVPLTTWRGYGANLPQLHNAAAAAGHFNPMVDRDGITRRMPLIVEHEGRYYAAFSLAVARTLLGPSVVVPGFASHAGYSGLEWLELRSALGTRQIPVDEQAAALIPFRGGEGSFRYIPAADVLQGRLPKGALAGKVALVGASAPALLDQRSAPVGNAYPGVEFHANMIAGILDGTVMQKPGYVVGAEAAMVVVSGLALILLLPLLSPLRATLLAFTLTVIDGLIILLAWREGVVLPVAATLWTVGGLFALNMAWGYFVESKTKRQFSELFGQYVPPELVDEMARDPESYSMAGKSERLTVLFADVRNFTSFAEGLAPNELAQLMNEYFGAMTSIIRRHRGTLDKYIGDAIMAFWGAPVADAEHARRAILAALEMQRAVAGLDESFRRRGWQPIRIGIGVNTGTMVVGDMGSQARKAYTVVGDSVNLASRLEGLTKAYGVGIIAGEDTRTALVDFVWREIDRVRVAGKDDPVSIYEPLGRAGEVPAELIDENALWHLALYQYRAQDWDQAELNLLNLSRRQPGCRLYELYTERVQRLRREPPIEVWDGVTAYASK